MRAPFQVLAFPFIKEGDKYCYAVLFFIKILDNGRGFYAKKYLL